MDRPSVVEALAGITGTWSSPRGDRAALAEARRLIGESLLAGTTVHELSPWAASRALLIPESAVDRYALETQVAGLHAAPEPIVRPFVHSALDLDPGSFQSTAGMKVEKSLGPFIDHLGIEHFVDLLPTPQKFPIEGTAGTLALLILARVPQPSSTPTHVELGPGSLWIAVPALTGGTQSTGFVGIEFSDGSADLVNVQSGPGGSLVLKAGARLTLTLTLVDPAPTGGTSSIGADAVALNVTLPTHITLVFEAPGAAIAALDNSSATLYNTSFTLIRNATKPHVTIYGAPHLLVPCDVSLATFAIGTCASADFITSGVALVRSGGWALPIANTPPVSLGAPDGAGGIALELGPGIAASFGTFTAPTPLADTAFLLHPAAITVFAHTGKRELHDRLVLWGPAPLGAQNATPPPIRRVSEIDLTIPRIALVSVAIVPGSETVTVACNVVANLDRPLAADGSRLPLAYTLAFARFIHDVTGKRVLVTAAIPPQVERGHVIALENALVGTGPSIALAFLGTRAGPAWVGRLGLTLPIRGILPMLPDPYAASFPPQQLIDRPSEGSLVVSLAWTTGTVPDLVFASTGNLRPMGEAFTLLDVSTNSDQFGVSSLGQGTFSIDGLSLQSVDRGLAVYALPGISWEPVVSDIPPAPVEWQNAFSPDDGPATLLRTTSVDLVRVDPGVALPHFQKTASTVLTRADFTLPFGILAHLTTSPQINPDLQPSFLLNDAHYKGALRNGLQLSIVANPKSFIPHSSRATVPPDPAQLSGPALPGFATTGSPAKPPDPSIYGTQVLGFQPLDAGVFFDQQFTDVGFGGKYPGIPVSRVDLSGYGTSMFSDWYNEEIHSPPFPPPQPGLVGVVRSRFDVLIGRTAYELLVLQSVICPWSIRITRAIIFDRYNTGLIVKHDTGWKPVGRGAFELLQPAELITSPIQSLDNIHNIAIGTGSGISIMGPDSGRRVDFVPVTFDADLNLDFSIVSVSANGKINVPPACTRIAGFAQTSIGSVATHDEVLALMDKVGPSGVTGQLGCILSVGALAPGTPQFTQNISSIRTAATSTRVTGKTGETYPAAIAVALNGTPRLPRDGAWSIARRARTAQTPSTVDPATPIPLVRARSGLTNQWRLLEPMDAAAPDTPDTFYGVLQGSGASKILFEHTIIDNAGKALHIDPAHVPNLADVGALLGASDIFPNLGSVLNLDTQPNPLNLVGDGFKQTYDQDINQPDRTIFQLGIIKIVVSYQAPPGKARVIFRLDPAASPRWSLDVKNISFQVRVDGFGSDPLLTIYGDFSASETSKPSMNNIQVEYGSALEFVQTIFSGLGPLIKEVGGDVDLDVAFSQNHLSVRSFLAVPTIPLGFGGIHDITVELGFDTVIPASAGFHVGLGSKQKPFTWLVSPLSGTGALVIGVENGDLDVYVEAGLGLGLEINLAVASGAASITLGLAIETPNGTISVTGTLLGQAEVDVLGGLASASLTLAASLTLTPNKPLFPPDDIEITAAVAVGIHISLCWVINVDFDGSFQFSQEVPVAF